MTEPSREMVKLSEVPTDLDPEINEAAADACAEMVKEAE